MLQIVDSTDPSTIAQSQVVEFIEIPNAEVADFVELPDAEVAELVEATKRRSFN